MTVSDQVLASFYEVLVDEIRAKRPEYLEGPFTVAEIYQDLVPYPTHRDRIGVEMNGDYEDALIRLLAGEGGYLELESDHALRRLRTELQSSNPNTGVYREFAAVDVRLGLEGAQESERRGSRIEEVGVRPESEAVSTDEVAGGAANGRSGREIGASSPVIGSSAAEGSAEGALVSSSGDCQWCKAPLPARDDLNFCPYCGTNVRSVPCAACGAEMEAEWRFCIGCGTERTP